MWEYEWKLQPQIPSPFQGKHFTKSFIHLFIKGQEKFLLERSVQVFDDMGSIWKPLICPSGIDPLLMEPGTAYM